MKINVILLVFALTAFAAASGRGRSHSITWGARTYRDMHLHREIITEKSKFLRVVTREFVFDQKVGYSHLKGYFTL